MLILASASPTRRQLIENTGFEVLAIPAQLDERGIEESHSEAGKPSAQLAEHLARAKAESVAQLHPDALVIGADQTLDFEGETLHKPADLANAAVQLRRLRDATHTLTSAVALVRNGACVWSHTETAQLTMRDFSEAELQEILTLEGDAVLGSVGAYRLEGASIRLFDEIDGDYFTILGLPLLPLLQALRTYG